MAQWFPKMQNNRSYNITATALQNIKPAKTLTVNEGFQIVTRRNSMGEAMGIHIDPLRQRMEIAMEGCNSKGRQVHLALVCLNGMVESIAAYLKGGTTRHRGVPVLSRMSDTGYVLALQI